METKKAKKKSAEQMAQEHTYDNLIGMIVAKTFSRHAGMSEQDYLKEIGFADKGKTEDEAVRTAFLNVLVASTKELLQARQDLKNISAVLLDCVATADDRKEIEELKAKKEKKENK